MAENKKTFTVKIDDKDVNLAVLRPTQKVQTKAQQVSNKAFREAVESGAILRAKINAIAREQNLWDETKQKRFEELHARLLENERKLAMGGKAGLTKNQAKKLALEMRGDRWELRQLTLERNQLDIHSAESQAENAKFNYFVSACTVYDETGDPYYTSYEDYMSRENDVVGNEAALHLGKMIHGLEENWEAKLPENEFLVKYKFVNDKLHLVDEHGNLVNADNKRVDDKGRLINDKGELIDDKGNVYSEDGKYQVEFEEFLDD